jgi:hypothetical protein
MFFRRADKKNDEGQISGQQNFDEFDKILMGISLNKLQHGHEQVFDHEDKILEIYKQRVNRKDFPAVSFLPYLQYGLTHMREKEINSLSIYAFATIFEKLKWVEKIEAIDVATRT